MTEPLSKCCQAWVVEASEGIYCSKCKEDVKMEAVERSPDHSPTEVVNDGPIPSHGRKRMERLQADGYQSGQD